MASPRQVADEGIKTLRLLGTSETEIFPFRVERDRTAGELGKLLATRLEAEAALAALGRPPPGS
jgi:hypothetical protein